MSVYSLWGSLEIGLIFGLLALGVLISFRVLNFPDLTVDGSFPLGGAAAAILIHHGYDPFVATGIGTLAAGFAGVITGWLNVRLKIMDLLASILMMIALYSINLRVMDAPNVPLITESTVFTVLQPAGLHDYVARPLILLVLVVVVKLALDWFFATQVGLAMRSTGSNPRMARSQGIRTGNMVLLGMGISNALCGLAGALFEACAATLEYGAWPTARPNTRTPATLLSFVIASLPAAWIGRGDPQRTCGCEVVEIFIFRFSAATSAATSASSFCAS